MQQLLASPDFWTGAGFAAVAVIVVAGIALVTAVALHQDEVRRLNGTIQRLRDELNDRQHGVEWLGRGRSIRAEKTPHRRASDCHRFTPDPLFATRQNLFGPRQLHALRNAEGR